MAVLPLGRQGVPFLDLFSELHVAHLGQKQAQGLNTFFLIKYLQAAPFPGGPGWLTLPDTEGTRREAPAEAVETLQASHWKQVCFGLVWFGF